MKQISKEEYEVLMDYLEPQLGALWDHENKEREKQGKDSLESLQFRFPITEIYHHVVNEDYDFYLLFNSISLSLIWNKIPEALKRYPEKFGTGNAEDVIDALYGVSGYNAWGDKNRYKDFLAEKPCAYVVYRQKGQFTGEIIRIDIFRLIERNKKDVTKFDFTGGLLHSLKHFSIDNKNLSTGKYIYNVFDIQHIVYLIAMAFHLKEKDGKRYIAFQDLGDDRMRAVFYKEEESGIFFLVSYYKESHNQHS